MDEFSSGGLYLVFFLLEVPCVAAEDKIAKDGLIGLGAVGVGAAVLGGVLSALAASGRRR